MIVPETSEVEGFAEPRRRLVDGWWTPSLPKREKEALSVFLDTGSTDTLPGPIRRGIEATWRRVSANT